MYVARQVLFKLQHLLLIMLHCSSNVAEIGGGTHEVCMAGAGILWEAGCRDSDPLWPAVRHEQLPEQQPQRRHLHGLQAGMHLMAPVLPSFHVAKHALMLPVSTFMQCIRLPVCEESDQVPDYRTSFSKIVHN